MLYSYFFILLLILVIGVSAIYHVRHVYNNGDTIYEDNLKAVYYLKSLNSNVGEVDRYLTSMIRNAGTASNTDNKAAIDNLYDKNLELISSYESLNLTSSEKKRFKECKKNAVEYMECVDAIIALIEQNNVNAAVKTYEQDLIPVGTKTYGEIDEAAEYAAERASKKNEDNYDYYVRAIEIILITTLIIAVAMAISFNMSNSFTSKLMHIQEWASGISQFNVTNDIPVTSDDEFGAAAKALNDAQFMIREHIGKIIEESDSMAGTGELVADAIRKSKARVENINLKELQYQDDGEQLDALIKKTMQQSDMNKELIDEWNVVAKKLEDNIDLSNESSKELMSVAVQLEQISITLDHQNEIALKHKEQVDKFKI